MTLSFVIPAWNEERLLPSTLRALAEAVEGSGASAEMIVVDNNSSDSTAEIAREFGLCKLVFEPVNNIARARNAGARAASGEVLVFVDADTKPSAAALSELLSVLSKGGVCGGGAALAFDAPLPFVARLSTALWNALSPRVGVAAGSFSFCLRSAFAETGGFDERLYAAEDVFFSLRLGRWGRRRKLRFVVLSTPVESSARRLGEGGVWKLFLKMLSLGLAPWRLRSKKACGLWYDSDSRDRGS